MSFSRPQVYQRMEACLPLIDWGTHFKTGHPEIDGQHKALIDTINWLHAALKEGTGLVEIERLLLSLKDSTLSHLRADGDLFLALEQLASTDLLTNAWNRRHFEEAVAGEMHRAQRYGHPVSLLLLDIDHFKRVNDTFGHSEGDRVLREVADRVRAVIRLSDSLTRWGGEEFIVLMPNTGISSATTLAERIREGLAARPFKEVGQVTASIGVAEYLPSASRDEWLERADRAMYRAKEGGRNRVEVDPARSEASAISEHMEGTFLKLVWSKIYLCGNPLIDAQHEHLFHLCNDLLVAFLSGRPVDEVSVLVTGLLSDVVQHFQDEERILGERGFPGLAEHAAKHADLLAKAMEAHSAFDSGTLSLGSLFQFLAQDVVALHMLKADREFFPLMAERDPT